MAVAVDGDCQKHVNNLHNKNSVIAKFGIYFVNLGKSIFFIGGGVEPNLYI